MNTITQPFTFMKMIFMEDDLQYHGRFSGIIDGS